MKKINLLLLVTLVAFGSVFTSCKNEDEPATVTVALDATSFNSGTAVTGTITSTNKLASVTLLLSGTTVSGWPITSFATGQPVVGDDGSYTIRITGLASGSYTITATDKDGVQSSKEFTVGSTSVITGTLTVIATGKTITGVQQDATSGLSCCASATGSTYTASNAATVAGTIDFVYFNGNPSGANVESNNTIYSPNSASGSPVPTVSSIFSTWSPKNATIFAEVTSKTNTAVETALASSSTKISVGNGDLIAFKTAAGKYGVLTVTGVGAADSWGGNSSITVTIELFQ